MASFFDTKGVSWHISLDIATASRVRGMCEVNLLDTEEVLSLFSDPIKLVDVIYCVVKPQADSSAITDEEFGARLNCDQLEAAARAFEVALVDFFPSRRRAALELLFKKQREWSEMASKKAEEVIESDALDKMFQEGLNKTLGRYSGK